MPELFTEDLPPEQPPGIALDDITTVDEPGAETPIPDVLDPALLPDEAAEAHTTAPAALVDMLRRGTTSTRTHAMALEGERLYRVKYPGQSFRVMQRGWNPGGVLRSSGTHDKDALDLYSTNLSDPAYAVSCLRRVGFAVAFPRSGPYFPDKEIHLIPTGGVLSLAAANQVRAVLNGENGLANRGADTFDRTYVKAGYTWETYLLNKAAAAASAAAAKAATPAFPGNLRRGMKGPNVRVMQQRLKTRWRSSILVDSIFGPATEGFVKTFQRNTNLTIDGVVGPKTWARMWK